MASEGTVRSKLGTSGERKDSTETGHGWVSVGNI
jgi:hypothetical protein